MNHVLSTHLFVNHRLTVALAGPDPARRHSGRGDLLRPAAPGLPRQGPDRGTRPLVPRLRAEAALAARAHVHRRDLGPLRPARRHHHHRAGEGASASQMVDEIKRALEIAETIPFRYLIQHIGVGGRGVRRAQVRRRLHGARGAEPVRPAARRGDPAGEHSQRASPAPSGCCCSMELTHLGPELLLRRRPRAT